MRKKVIFAFTFALYFILLMNKLEIFAKVENSFYNLNGILINENDYKIFNALGYDEQDINYITYEQIQKLRDINIDQSFSNTYYIETEYISYDGIVSEVVERYINKDEFDNKITEKNQEINTFALVRPGVSTSTFDYKTMTVSGVYDNSKGVNGCFTIRVTVTWNTNPDFFDEDIIGIKYDNLDIILNQVRVENGNSYVYRDDFYLVFWHNLNLYNNYQLVDEQEIVRGYYLGNNSQYTNSYYDVEDRYGLAVTFDFPQIPVPEYKGNADEDGYGYSISDMKIALEATFYATRTISFAKFTGFYIHYTPQFEIDFDFSDISFIKGTKILNIFSIISFDRYFREDELDILFSNLQPDDNVGTC